VREATKATTRHSKIIIPMWEEELKDEAEIANAAAQGGGCRRRRRRQRP
jgi:hypothetical protein